MVGDAQPVRQWEVMGELRKRIIAAFVNEGVRTWWSAGLCAVLDAPRTPAGRSASVIPAASSWLLLSAGRDFAGKPGRIIRKKVGYRRSQLSCVPQLRISFH